MMRRCTRLLAAKVKNKGASGDAGTGMKSSDEDKAFQLFEEYGDGTNYYTKLRSKEEMEHMKAYSRIYDDVVGDLQIAREEMEAEFENAQSRAMKALPEVLRAAASRPSTTTFPLHFRKPTDTPPAPEYHPPSVESLDMYEVPQELVTTLHTGLKTNQDIFMKNAAINDDDSPVSLRDEEVHEEQRMQELRESYLWWRDQKDFGPRAETVDRDFMQMKHEQEIKLYTIRRARHGKNDYIKRRQQMVAPVLRDDTEEGVMYRRAR